MLIDTRDPPPGDRQERPAAWEPNWRVCAWVAVSGLVGFAALSAGGALETLLILVAFAAACRAVALALPYGGGLREWRQ
jgi:hypothetical protein